MTYIYCSSNEFPKHLALLTMGKHDRNHEPQEVTDLKINWIKHPFEFTDPILKQKYL